MNAPVQTTPLLSESLGSRSTRDPVPWGEQDAFTRYLGRIGGHPLLSAEGERVLASELWAGKRAVWVALLELPAVVSVLCDLPASTFGDTEGPQLVAAVAGDDDPRLRTRLAEVLVDVDPDMDLAERLSAELGREGDPPTGDRTRSSTHARVEGAWGVVRSARARFVSANLRLVLKTAMAFRGRGVAVSDLVQEGNLGLMKAVDRFDHRRGFRFSTYAMWWIKNAASRAVANHGRTIRVPIGIRQTYGRISRTAARLEVEHGRAATDEELAQLLSESETTITRARTAMIKPLSLDAPVAEDARELLCDRIRDEDADAFADAMDDEAALVRRALETLGPLEAQIVRRRFGLDDGTERTLQEIADAHHLSRERIRQLQKRALGKLRKFMVAATR